MTSMVNQIDDNNVNVSDFQIILSLNFCHFNHDTITRVKIDAKPSMMIKKQMSSNYLSISILKLVISASVKKPKLFTFSHLRMISL